MNLELAREPTVHSLKRMHHQDVGQKHGVHNEGQTVNPYALQHAKSMVGVS